MSIHILNNKPMTNSYYPTSWAFSTDPFPAFRASSHGVPHFIPFAKGMTFSFPNVGELYKKFWDLNSRYILSKQWEEEAPQELKACMTTGGDRPDDSDRRYALLNYVFGKDGHRGRCPDGEAKHESVLSDTTPCKLIRTKKGTDLIVPCPKEEDEHIMLFQGLGGFRGGICHIGCVGGTIVRHKHTSKHCTPVWTGVAVLREQGYVHFETGRRCSTGTVVRMGFKPDGTIGTWSMTAEEHKVQQELGL